MKKFKYNFNSVPTTKKQILTAIITIIIFLFIPLILDIFNISSDLLPKLKYILRLFVTIIGFTIIILDNHKLVKKLMKTQKNDYLNYLEVTKKIQEFEKQEELFCYNNSNNDERINHVLYALIVACNTSSTGDFYVLCSDYSMNEIKEILSGFKFSKDFSNYLNRIIYKYKSTRSIKNYAIEIENILNNRLFNTSIDDKLFDDNVLYNMYRNVRAWVEYDQSVNRYLLHYEAYTDKCGYLSWQQLIKYTYYKKSQSAWNFVNKAFSKMKQEDINYFKEEDIDKDILNYMMLLNTCKEDLIEPYKTLDEYRTYINIKGHYDLYNYEPDLLERIIKVSKEYISEEYYNELIKLTLCKGNIEKLKQMDDYYSNNRHLIVDAVAKYAETFNFKILQ